MPDILSKAEKINGSNQDFISIPQNATLLLSYPYNVYRKLESSQMRSRETPRANLLLLNIIFFWCIFTTQKMQNVGTSNCYARKTKLFETTISPTEATNKKYGSQVPLLCGDSPL